MLKKIFHSIVIAVVIVHIAICSEFFGGTSLWSYLTYMCAFFFVVVGVQYLRLGRRMNRLERLSIFYFIFLFFLTILYGNASTNLVPLIGRSMEIAILLMIVKIHKDDLAFVLVTGTVVFSVCVYCNLCVVNFFRTFLEILSFALDSKLTDANLIYYNTREQYLQ